MTQPRFFTHVDNYLCGEYLKYRKLLLPLYTILRSPLTKTTKISNINILRNFIVAAKGLVACQPTWKLFAFYEGVKRQISLQYYPNNFAFFRSGRFGYWRNLCRCSYNMG